MGIGINSFFAANIFKYHQTPHLPRSSQTSAIPQPNMGMFKNPVSYLYSGWVIGIPQYIGQCNSLTSAIQPLKIIQPAVTYQLHPITKSHTLWLNSVKQPEHEASNPTQSYHNKINRIWNTACLRQLLYLTSLGFWMLLELQLCSIPASDIMGRFS